MPATSPSPAMTPNHGLSLWFRLLPWLILAGVIIAGYFPFARKIPVEVEVYLRGAGRMYEGEPVYRVGERAFTYPPFMGLALVPLHLTAEPLRIPLWYAVNVGVLALILWCVHRRVRHFFPTALPDKGKTGLSPGPAPWVFWLLLALVVGRHVMAPLENQSHDLLVFLCVVLAIEGWCLAWPTLCGVWAGVGTALKCTPLLFAPFLLWQRKILACITLLAAVGTLTLLPDVVLPAHDGNSWVVSWYQTFIVKVQPGAAADHDSAWAAWGPLNQSLAGSLHRLFRPMEPGMPFHNVTLMVLPMPVVRGIILLAQLGTFAWLLWVSRPRLTAGLREEDLAFQRFGEGAVLATAMALMSPTSIKTHFCVLLLPAAFCLADFLYRKRDWLNAMLLLAVFVLGTVTVKDVLGQDLGNLILTSGSVTGVALLLMLASGRTLLSRGRELHKVCREGSPVERPAAPLKAAA